VDAEPKKRNLAARVKKAVIRRATRYLSTPEGMATFNKALDAKKKADRLLADLYETAGLPSLLDKRQVEWAVDRQIRRLRELNADLDHLDETLKRLERALANLPEAAPAPVVEITPPVAPPAPVEPPPPPAPEIETQAPKPVKKPTPSAKARKPAPPKREKKAPAEPATAAKAAAGKRPAPAAKPKPLGAVGASPEPARKGLLDLDWKGKPKKKGR
jgi:outer membrane biosynthesis protein TonB